MNYIQIFSYLWEEYSLNGIFLADLKSLTKLCRIDIPLLRIITPLKKYTFILFYLKFYSFFERECVWVGRRAEGEEETQADTTLSSEPTTGLVPTTQRADLSRNQESVSQLREPPRKYTFILILTYRRKRGQDRICTFLFQKRLTCNT